MIKISVGIYQLSVKYRGRTIKMAPNNIVFPLEIFDVNEFAEKLRRPFSRDNVELNLKITNVFDVSMDFTFYSPFPLDQFSRDLIAEILFNSEMTPYFRIVQSLK